MPDLKTREETFRDMLQRKFTFTPTTRSRVDRLLGKLFLTCAVLAIAAFIIEYGFFPNDATRTALHIIESVIIFIFCLMPLSRLLFVRKRLGYLREHMAEFIILGVYIIYVATSGEVSDVATNIWEGGGQSSGDDMIAGQLFIAANLIIRFARGNRSLASLSVRPVQFILFSFIGVIAVGTLLLSLPRATVAGYIHPIDAFFTATSATCVTGLVVVDTGSYFTRFGQGVIMSLFQIGGLGLMAFTAFFSTILGVKLARKEVALYSRAYEADTFSKVRRLLLYMLLATLLVELLGFGLLYQTWEPKFPDKGDLLFSAAFHSVSAFCNAGFSLNATNMEPYVHSTGTSMIVSWLIILGGLGFLVLMNLTTFRRKAIHGKPRSRLSLQTKLVLVTTVVLLLFGWLTITPLEWDNSFEGLSFGEKVTAGWFQSVTTRTAGFNTTPFNNLAPTTIFIMIVLMFIGASPGSTGGGIKTSTFAIVILNLWRNLTGKDRLEVFKREIPDSVTQQALAVLVGGISFVVLGYFMLLLFETHPPLDLLFETVSAYATVGLSTGVTSTLSYAGRIVIIILMFAGRVGPLSLGLAIGRRHAKGKYRYPRGNISVG